MQDGSFDDANRLVLYGWFPSKGQANIVLLRGGDDQHGGIALTFEAFCIVGRDGQNERTRSCDAGISTPFS